MKKTEKEKLFNFKNE
jgi:hypothetical protein